MRPCHFFNAVMMIDRETLSHEDETHHCHTGHIHPQCVCNGAHKLAHTHTHTHTHTQLKEQRLCREDVVLWSPRPESFGPHARNVASNDDRLH